MVLPEDSNNAIVDALNRINESLEENNEVLNRIAKHYDSVVPVMKRNADRVDEAHNKAQDEFGWGDYLNPKKVFNN
jgi:hypothetical protein